MIVVVFGVDIFGFVARTGSSWLTSSRRRKPVLFLSSDHTPKETCKSSKSYFLNNRTDSQRLGTIEEVRKTSILL